LNIFKTARLCQKIVQNSQTKLVKHSGPCSGVYHLGHYKSYWTTINY